MGAGNSAPQGKHLFAGGTYPFFRTSDVGRTHVGTIDAAEDHLNESGIRGLRPHPAGTILIPKSGASTFLDHRVVMGVDGYVSSHLATVRAKPTIIDTKYLFYFLLTVEARGLGVDTAYPTLSLAQISAINVSLPTLSEQQRIVAILDEAFAGLAIATANAEKNLKNARELFESYLNSIFATTGEKWRRTRVSDFAQVFDGPHATPKTVESGPVFLGIGALKDGIVELSETRHVTADDFKKWTRRVKPQPADVVFSYETRLGQAAIIPENLECCLGRRMGLVRVDRSKVEPRFFLYQYLSRPFQSFLKSQTVQGATVDRISIKDFPAFELQIAPVSEQRRIVDLIDQVAGHCGALAKKYNDKLTHVALLKQSLLQNAFSGELTSPPMHIIQQAAE